MIQSLYSAASGLVSQQKNIDVIANNVSNMETTGYKKTRFDFQDALYAAFRAPYPASNGAEKNLQRGNGTIEYQTARVLTQGPLLTTGRILDFAIEGQGFFAVENPNPDEDSEVDNSTLYTRSGNFYLSPEEEGNFLTDSHGRYILDTEGNRINIPDASTLSVSSDGTLKYITADGNTENIASLMIVYFTNPAGLANAGQDAYMETINCGERVETEYAIVQNSLEGSNVDYAEEVTRLIRAQRAYQMAAQCVSTADQMMGLANSIRT